MPHARRSAPAALGPAANALDFAGGPGFAIDWAF
jgi:hypothetical protein